MNNKSTIVRAILLDASECERPEADHPAAIEISAEDLQRILERHITAEPQATPFMWAIQEPGGGAYMDVGCVSSVREDVQAEVDGLNCGLDADDDPYKVVPVYLAAAQQAPAHPDDAAVDALAALMKAKLAEKRAKGYGGWNDKTQCPQQRLSDMLRAHVDKGDPVDVANFCAMLSARGEGIAAAQQVAVPVERGEVLVTVSGFTGSGKSAIAGEIEIMCRALGLQVEWPDGVAEKNMTHADWTSALEMYNPRVRIMERNVSLAVAVATTQPAAQEMGAQQFRLVERGELIEAGDQFLRDDFTWQIDPRGIFVGVPHGAALRPARRALATQAKQEGAA